MLGNSMGDGFGVGLSCCQCSTFDSMFGGNGCGGYNKLVFEGAGLTLFPFESWISVLPGSV